MRRLAALLTVLAGATLLTVGCAGGPWVRSGQAAGVDILSAAGERWLAALKDDRPFVRATAAEMLGLLRSEGATAGLLEAVSDPDPRVAEAALRTLTGASVAIPPHTLVLALAHPAPAVREAAAKCMKWTGRADDFRDDIPRLVTAARSGDPAAQHAALYILSKLKDPRAAGCLAEAARSGDIQSRSLAIPSLAEAGDPHSHEILEAALTNAEWLVRAVAVRALQTAHHPRAVELAIPVLRDANPSVRWSAVVALGRSGDPRAVAPLVAALDDPEPFVREDAAVQLERMTHPAGLERQHGDGPPPDRLVVLSPQVQAQLTDRFASLLAENWSDTYEAAARFLIKHPDPRCVPQVVAAARTGATLYTRRNAIHVLVALEGQRAIGPLVSCLADGDALVRSETRRALLKFPAADVVAAALAAPELDRPAMRAEVIRLLREFGDGRAVDLTIAGLADADASVRRAAAQEAAKLPADVRLLEPLVAATGDDQFYVRAAAATSLLAVPGNRAAEAVASVLKGDSVDARRLLVNSVAYDIQRGKLAGPSGATIGYDPTPLLAEALHDKDERVRRGAIMGLGSLGGEGAWDSLYEVFKGETAALRPDALGALSRWKDGRTWEVLAAAIKDSDPKVAAVAAVALGGFTGPRTIPLLEEALASPDYNVHIAASRALERLGRLPRTDEEKTWLMLAHDTWSEAVRLSPASLDALRSALKDMPEGFMDDRPYELRLTVERGLICDARGGPKVEAALKDPSAFVRGTVAIALGRGKDPDAARLLIPCLKDADDGVRAAAAVALGYIGDTSAIPAIAEMLGKEPSEPVIHEAVPAIAWFRDERVFPLLLTALANSDAYMRTMAAVTLGNLGDARAVEPLRNALTDYHAGVVHAAREALGKLGHPVPGGQPRQGEAGGK